MEAPTQGAPDTPSREWVLPLIVIIVGVGVLAALVIGGLSLLGRPSSSASPSAVATTSVSASPSSPEETQATPTHTATSSGTETSVFDLEVGDCFSAESDQLETVVVVDCEQPHEYETFFVFDHEAGPDDAFPGDPQLLEYADTACQPPFEEFVGHDYQTSIWFIAPLTPSEATWVDGDREIVCTLDQQDDTGEPITVSGSARGSAE
jgi:hypothetical protein